MLEKIKKSIDRGIVSAGVQSSTYLETGKLRSKIDHLENAISQIKVELGQTVYANWKNGADNTAYIEDVGNRIRGLEQEIEDYQTKILELQAEKDRIISGGTVEVQGTLICSCGQRNSADAKFCTGCGKPVEQTAEQTGNFCANCGAVVSVDAKFCTNCGAAQNNP